MRISHFVNLTFTVRKIVNTPDTIKVIPGFTLIKDTFDENKNQPSV